MSFCTPHLASQVVPLNPETLQEISNTVQLPDDSSKFIKTWKHANLEPNLIPAPSNVSGEDIWTGTAQYRATAADNVVLTQLALDILLYYPTKPYSGLIPDDKLNDLFVNNTGKQPTENDKALLRSVLQSFTQPGVDQRLGQALFNLNSLYQRSLSCDSTWEGTNFAGRDPLQVAIIDEGNNTIPTPIPQCQKPICTTRVNEAFNGFYKIHKDVELSQKAIKKLPCSGLTGNTQQHKLCTDIVKYASFPVLDQAGLSVPSLETGKAYIQNLNTSLKRSVKSLQSLVALRLNLAITLEAQRDERFRQYLPTSVVSLFTPESSTPLPNCTRSSNKTQANACGSIGSEALTNVSDMINQMTGITGDYNTIFTAPSIGEPDTNKLTLLIAGDFVEFTQSNKLWRSGKALKDDRSSELNKQMLISTQTKSSLDYFRTKLISDFYSQRTKNRNAAMQNLITESAANQSMSLVYSQNTASYRYMLLPKGEKTQSALMTLQEGSQWRMSPQSEWLANISAMSNVNLLREIVVLLAEMKQLQFLTFLTSYQSMVMTAINVGQSTGSDVSALNDTLDDDMTYYLGSFTPGGDAVAENSADDLTALLANSSY